jgi:hypothetical protein
MRDLFAVAARDIADAGVTQLSLDRRFATAYGAALQFATAAIAASGYRVAAQRGHHAVVWQVLPEVMGAEVGETAVYFDSCRALRNRSDYDAVGVVTAADVDEILREALAFREVVLAWLHCRYPKLAP